MLKKLCCLLVLIFFISGCTFNEEKLSNEDDSLTYDTFKQSFLGLKEEFKPSEFSLISSEDLEITTTSFPENKFSEHDADMIDGDVFKPIRYQAIYESLNKTIIAKVNYIFFPGGSKNDFITINSTLGDKKKVSPTIPNFDEYILYIDNYLLIINFYEADNSDKININEKEFIDETVNFYKELESTILSLNTNARAK